MAESPQWLMNSPISPISQIRIKLYWIFMAEFLAAENSFEIPQGPSFPSSGIESQNPP
jgi:hypothetical protein